MTTSPQPAPRSRLGEWLNERLGLQGIAYAVPEHANSLPYVLGGITLPGFLILFVTGIRLRRGSVLSSAPGGCPPERGVYHHWRAAGRPGALGSLLDGADRHREPPAAYAPCAL